MRYARTESNGVGEGRSRNRARTKPGGKTVGRAARFCSDRETDFQIFFEPANFFEA
jgi:hypothetical protein